MLHPLTVWIRARHGVAHTSDARDAGFTPHHVTRAIGTGEVERVRRSWLVTGDVDPARRAAAAVGGRVTCLSAARLLGLWTPGHDDVHVALPRTDSRVARTGLRVHTAHPPIALPRRVAEEPVINVLFHVAQCMPPPEALAVWDSALRNKMTDASILALVQWRSARARRLAEAASDLSHSGIETRFVTMMRAVGVAVAQQIWIDGHPVDGLIGERLVVQLDGFAHHSEPKDRRRDLAQDARLTVRGYAVLRFDYAQVMFDPQFVIDQALTAIAQGRHMARRR